ncbi:DNA repair protein RAD51 homolog 4-like [Lytechinus variegatus]|uniref:DNA repair protein RAD51 homolog 4-like n=1 Tax=Lytechinus variegatus TaxID=7654 RepID=UPI001BB27994|nr:DNA repair protein RAD51 homolog 4-like [Lytechinus variegatus]
MPILQVGMCPSMTSEVLKSLNMCGVKTVIDFVTTDTEELSQKCSLSYKVLSSIRRLLLAQYSAFPINGSDLYDEVLSTVAYLSTGCDSIDKLLDSGVYTSEVTEVVGQAAIGKTQFCLTLASCVAVSSEQNVLYVDTNGGFDAGRLHEIIAHKSTSEKITAAALQKVHCAKTFDLYDLLDLLESIKASIDSGTDVFYSSLKLVVLDSVTAVLAPLLGGKHSEGQGMMVHLARSLKSLAADYSIAVVVCNNMVRGERGEPKPSLGRTWLSVPHTRIQLRADGRDGITSRDDLRRTASLVKSQRQAINTSCNIAIGNQGVYG